MLAARLILAASLVLALVLVRTTERVAADSRTPRLIVLLVVDQFRADYIDRFGHQWSSGLRRLTVEGARFRQVQYPFYDTVTCAGHATISTGTMPSTHGMVMNDWWDRGSRKVVTCMEDTTTMPISYGAAVKARGESLARLRVPALADELRSQLSPAGRAIGFSLKARSAAPLAGRHPDAVAWFDDSGAWVTSSAFSNGPVPELADFVRRHPVDGDFSRIWDRALPKATYLYEDPAIGVGPLGAGMTAAFPHTLAGTSPSPDRNYYTRWQSSPYADEYLASMAIDVARGMRLGTPQGSTDMIAVGFSTLDKVGHDYGPNSHEVQDVLIRLDRTLGDLFVSLDELAGAGNYVVALTSDHGVAPIPERARQFGLDAGRLDGTLILRTVDDILVKAFGKGNYLSRLVDSHIYFQPGVYARLRDQPAVLRGVRDALRAIDGIDAVYTADELENVRANDDAMARRLAGSYFSGRSGDLVFVTRPYWMVEAEGTTHGTGYGYDTHVPLLLMGKGIVPGEYLGSASPLDVAPTLGFLANVTLPYSQGRVLSEALSVVTPAPRASSPATR